MQEKSISSKEMGVLEANAEYFGISLLQLMENAGRNVAEEIGARFNKDCRILIICGLGGNGGDGFVAARHLLSLGFDKLAVVLVGKAKSIVHESALVNWLALQNFRDSIPICEITDVSEMPKISVDVVVDALLGTGTKGKLRPPVSQFVDFINSVSATKIAVDVPTGIDSDSGEILGTAVKSDVTVTFHRLKPGLEKAKNHVGELIVREIGLPYELETFAGPGDVTLVTKMRALTAHKGDFGRALFIGGSETFSGAPALMSMAALRTGVDIAYTASPEKTAHDVASMSPDLITIKLDGDHLNQKNLILLKDYFGLVDAIVIGPGVGLHSETKSFIRACVKAIEEAGIPILLDADGLKAFSEFKRSLKVPLVLTPHAGEFAILMGKSLPDDLEGRVQMVKKAAAELSAIILLKGKVDIISDGRRTKLNFTGNPGMTVGGTGDVLSGIVGALLAQKIDPFEAAVAGAFVNGAAGDLCAAEIGFHMVATDLLSLIPQVLNDPAGNSRVRKVSGKSA